MFMLVNKCMIISSAVSLPSLSRSYANGFVDLVHFIDMLAIKTKSICIVELIKLVILMKTVIQM